MSKIVWEDPPGRKVHGRSASIFNEELRNKLDSRAGQWAIICELRLASGAANNASVWRYRWPAYEFRSSGKKIYARRKTRTRKDQ